MDRPIIFLAFSNDQDDYLPMINRERKNIYRSLRWYNDNNVIKLEVEATTSLEDIFEVFTIYDNRIAIFHFAGHAGNSSLLLQQQDNQTASAYMEGLAGLLEYQQNLQLVFLNGCATKGQVQLLLDRGIPAVIATDVAIGDKMATEFAELFYNSLAGHSSIEKAFHIATAFIRSKYNNVGTVGIHRGIVLEFDEAKMTDKLPWGLYLHEGKEEVLKWTLPFPENTYQSSNTKNLLNKIPSSTTTFVGYEKELWEFKDTFFNCRLIVIEGLGGVGKTEFSIECMKRYIPERDRIIWVSPITKFDLMIQQTGYEEILRTDTPDESLKFKSFEGLLDRDNRVVFIEDFHDNEDPTFLRFFGQLNLSSARIVILTRFLPEEIKPDAVIRLQGLAGHAMDHARNLRKRNTAYEDIPDSELEVLCQLTEGHPLSIELGIQLLGYGETAKDILNAISGGDYSEHKKVEDLSHRLLSSVLKHENTSKREREVLSKFSVFRDRVPLEAIESLFDFTRIKYPLSKLIEKSLIRHRNQLYDSPPLVREFCRLMLEEEEEVHELAADYFMDQRTAEFDIYLEENVLYHLSESNQWELLGDNIEKYGKLFIAHGQTQLLKGIIDQLNEHEVNQPIFDVFKAQILLAKGEPKKAKRPAKRALKNCREANDPRGIAMALNTLGDVHSGLSNLEEARKVLEESLSISLADEHKILAVTAYEYLTYVYTQLGKMEEALSSSKNGLDLARELNDQFGIASMLNAMGNVYWRQKKFNKALEVRRKSFDMFSVIGARIQMVVVSNNIAVILAALEKPEKSLKELEKSLEIEKEIGAKYRIANLYHNIGRILLKMGKQEKALKKLQECLQIHETIRYDIGKASAHHAIGICLTQMDRDKEAIQSFKKSLDICKRTGYRMGELTIYKKMGDLFEKLQEPVAVEWYLKALAFSRQIDLADPETPAKLDQLKELLGGPKFNEQVKESLNHISEELLQHLDLQTLLE